MADDNLAVLVEQLRTEVRAGFAGMGEQIKSLTNQMASSGSDMSKLTDRVSVLEKKVYTVASLAAVIGMLLPEGVKAAIGV